MLVACALGTAAVLAAAFGVVAFLERDTLPRGATVGGVDVGGMSESEARAAVEGAAEARIVRPIRLVGPDGRLAATSGDELRARPLVDEAIDTVLEEGTVGRVLARLGLRDGPDVGLAYRLAPVPAARLANRLDRRFAEPWQDARVAVDDDAVRIVEARSGTGVDRGALRRALRTLPSRVELRIVPTRPVVSTAEAEAAATRVERLLDGPRRVRFRDVESTLTPPRVCARSPARSATTGRSPCHSTRPASGRRCRLRLGRFEAAPRDATFAVGERRRSCRPLEARAASWTLRESGARSSRTSSRRPTSRDSRGLAPALTTEEAEKLDIREPISEFTTYYSCCQPRVTNIQRAAQLLDGTIVRPGEEFSLNGALGKRTEERGFVSAPQIFDGRLEDAVGGGISQVATTLYNAAFFAGVKLVAHQAHQFYISRYPMGREATVSWGGPELVFRNDWPAAILVKVAATDSAITVRFYSRKLGRRVETTTGEPYAETAPRTITDPQHVAPGGYHQHRSVGRRRRVHGAVHAEGVQGSAAREERALHRPLRPAERDRRAGTAEEVAAQAGQAGAGSPGRRHDDLTGRPGGRGHHHGPRLTAVSAAARSTPPRRRDRPAVSCA